MVILMAGMANAGCAEFCVANKLGQTLHEPVWFEVAPLSQRAVNEGTKKRHFEPTSDPSVFTPTNTCVQFETTRPFGALLVRTTQRMGEDGHCESVTSAYDRSLQISNDEKTWNYRLRAGLNAAGFHFAPRTAIPKVKFSAASTVGELCQMLHDAAVANGTVITCGIDSPTDPGARQILYVYSPELYEPTPRYTSEELDRMNAAKEAEVAEMLERMKAVERGEIPPEEPLQPEQEPVEPNQR